MRMSDLHINSRKWVFYLMAFTFFWLVIGDLITLHQKLIYDFDPYGLETPFAKTDNSSSKTKFDKGSKFDKSKDQHHLDVLLKKDLKIKVTVIKCDFEFINTFTVFLSSSGFPLVALRAPPTA